MYIVLHVVYLNFIFAETLIQIERYFKQLD